MSDEKPPITEKMVSDVLTVGAGAIASHDPLAGALAGLAIGPLSGAAGRVQQFFGDKFSRRIVQTTIDLGERTKTEGIEPDQEHLEELLENGLPFVGRASREAKRRMMEEILMNGVRSLENEAKRIEAIDALQIIEELPDGAALIFAAFAEKINQSELKRVPVKDDKRESFPDCGLNIAVYMNSLRVIYDFTENDNIKPKFSSYEFLVKEINFGISHKSEYCYVLTNTGKWLAEWITNNPAPRPKAEETTPTE